MCSGSKSELCPYSIIMEDGVQKQNGAIFCEACLLLELAASDDIEAFKLAVEEHNLGVDEASLWYGRRIGSNKMSLEERTPLMIASMFGSTKVLEYITGTNKVDVNRFCGSDKATALHCAASGGSNSSVEIVKLLIDASADVNSVDANGNKPINLIARSNLRSSTNLKRKTLEMLLKGANGIEESSFPSGWIGQGIEVEELRSQIHQVAKEGSDKKEYPIDVPLPDINTGVYGSDEFRMYSFKVKPCSRAYSHDWTECPFAHPGENARRRDPRKHFYSCVPCPEFRKGTCAKGDSCEYAHGVFESWLHPAQYRTRLCKDETGCARKVCFFAHKTEELRPLYASTGSAMPSPKSHSSSVLDMSALSPLSLGSSPSMMPPTSTPPMSPSSISSQMAGNMWQNKVNVTPPALQLPGSRLKAALNARDFELEMGLLGLENLRNQQHQRQQLIDELSGLSSPTSWNNGRMGELKPTNLDDFFGTVDPSLLSQLQGLSPNVGNTQLQSPSGHQMRQNMNQMRASYPTNGSSSPVRKSSMYGFDSSGAVASAVMNSRSAAFAKRSQSFVDRGAMNYRPGGLGLTAAANSASMMSSNFSTWGSPDGKLDWGYQGEDMSSKLKKSASFQYRSGPNNGMPAKATMGQSRVEEPDVSWVNTLVKDVPPFGTTTGEPYRSEQKNGGRTEAIPPWLEQMYIEQEQMQMAA